MICHHFFYYTFSTLYSHHIPTYDDAFIVRFLHHLYNWWFFLWYTISYFQLPSLFLSGHMDIFILSPFFFFHLLILESIWTQFTYWIYIFINCNTLDVNLNHHNFYLKSYISRINFSIQIDFIIKNVSWDFY